MANRHMKRKCSLIVRKVYIRTVARRHLIPVRKAIVQNTRSKSWWGWSERGTLASGWSEKGTLAHCWWECASVQEKTGWKMVWLKKLKIEPPYEPVIPLLHIYIHLYSMEMKAGFWRNIFTSRPSSLQNYSQGARHGERLSVHRWTNGSSLSVLYMCVLCILYICIYI